MKSSEGILIIGAAEKGPVGQFAPVECFSHFVDTFGRSSTVGDMVWHALNHFSMVYFINEPGVSKPHVIRGWQWMYCFNENEVSAYDLLRDDSAGWEKEQSVSRKSGELSND